MSESGRAKFKLSDEQWQSLAILVGLPAAARSEVELAVDLFQSFEDSDRTFQPQKITKALKRVEKKAGGLRDAISALDVEALRTMLRDSPTDISPNQKAHLFLRERDRFAERVSGVEQLERWVAAAARRVSHKPTRDAENLRWLVQELDCILWTHTRQRVSRSTKSGKDGPGACQSCCGSRRSQGWGRLYH
jgi:hypothetical protein